ncbi:MFS transporter [Gracilinema caldarium]|uniref:Major facilitator superfamily MFS_1 n=1 Tax=Gracilinema caldarium (strain ATCC 51460 / DSM 7334 / H1) TaxID=744872 RepID=F8EYV6_GRAC1|nr:MFS transporter [Gracilinema caldarium]AEJ18902.1 major facilitator superfamily MFS_1 [Gracilinema caldarium DSM 7334]
MPGQLTPYQIKKFRKLYNVFNAFNSFSFTILSGSVITLYALRLGATSTIIGILNAFVFSAFFFMPVGKMLVHRFPIVQVFATAWLIRYLVMIPLVIAPFFDRLGRTDIALALMILGVFAFHASRGVGMIGNNPVLNELATGPDRGAYMTHIQVISSAVSMFTSLGVALLLGRKPPLMLYALLMLIGIIAGGVGSLMLYRIPEPPTEEEGKREEFLAVVRRAWHRAPFRRFIIIFLTLSLISSVSRAFIVVYSRNVYFQGDGMVSLYSVFGSLGALAIGLLTRLLVDRVGAKPLYITYTFAAVISLLPAIISPFADTAVVVSSWVVPGFLALLFFMVNFAFAGTEGVAQTYFFGLIRPTDMLDLGILYYIVYGIAGAAGSFMAGLFLDVLVDAGLSSVFAFRILFAALTLLLLVVLLWQRKLIRLGALPLRGALGVIFSFRDLRALTLLDRLEKTRSVQEEHEVLEALHDVPSAVALTELLDRLRSPRLSVRIEALRAIEALESLNTEAEDALMEDVQNNPFTTAYISCRILGNHGVHQAIPLLRTMLQAEDYMLVGEAMLALARLGDHEYRTQIEECIKTTKNPRIRIMGAASLETFGSYESIQVLLDLLREENPPPYLRDEVVLSIAGIVGILERFYPLLVQYREDPALVNALALDEIEEIAEQVVSRRWLKNSQYNNKNVKHSIEELKKGVTQLVNSYDGKPLSQWIITYLGDTQKLDVYLFSQAILEDDLVAHDRFRLLVCTWAANRLLLRI